ncbi:MAG: glycogen synthase GlgA [Halanaerobiales bacterium]
MSSKLKILFVAPEVAPFTKTGGLADVAGSLPQALKEHGHDVRVVMPEYAQIPDEYIKKLEHELHFRTNIVWRNEYVGINKLVHEDVITYFVDNKNYFYRSSIYENNDKEVQFAFFARAVLEMLPLLDFKPDIIHCNDWQTGPICLMLEDNYCQYNFYQDIKTVFTIHNLRYQGHFLPRVVGDVLGVDSSHWVEGNIRHNGLVNYMKTGIMYADRITTVSKTYAEEIKTPYFGEELDYALRIRGNDLDGIINGISYGQFNPATDEYIFQNYSQENIKSKYKNKEQLQQKVGLPVDKEVPLIGIVSRLVEQKGFDLIAAAIDDIMENDLQLVVLGTGQQQYEEMFLRAAEEYPQKLAAVIKYDAGLARQIYAGTDLFLMPSRFEPCGLGQMIAMKYGTIPIVRETGGLNDTVINYDPKTNTGCGFSFENYNAHDMLHTIHQAIHYYSQPQIWAGIINRAMSKDFSWNNSAAQYLELYSELTGKKALIRRKQGKIDLNKADKEQLQQLKGIGPAYAERIIAYRKEHGKFKNKEEIMNVTGIAKRSYKNIKNKLTT